VTQSEIVQNALTQVLGANIGDKALIEKYFSSEYTQIVNGIELDYQGFISHMLHLKAATKSISIRIASIAESADNVHTHHFVQATKSDNTVSEFEVFARFRLKDGKIIRCYELTRQISGASGDQDLGSRQ
jgi:predicted SnoaL-like aldol condensation-catalyzing enzyme